MPPRSRPDFGGAVLGAIAIVLVSIALGLLANHFSSAPVPLLTKASEPQLPLPPGMVGLSLAEAKRRYDAHQTPFLDARQPEVYAEGHIPGAYNLPAEEFETRYLDLAEALEAAPAVVVYCESADCGEALATAERLKEAYPGKLQVFLGGWQEWRAAKYPTRTGEAP